uniref:SPRY domain-containing protein n=1 Tax=Globodera pallida TaxID=36090 RepID=A0A183CBS1_GLOPA
MDPSKIDRGSESGGGGFHANEEFGAADQQLEVPPVDIGPVGRECTAVTNRGNVFQNPVQPQHNIPEANGWARHHTQLRIVEPGTVINGPHYRATPHTAIAKFALSREKPYFEITIRQRLGQLSVGVCAISAPLNKRFDHGLDSDISPFGQTDIIGCGVLFNNEQTVGIIYTINGERMGKGIIGDNVGDLFPFVTLEGPEDCIEANFEGTFKIELVGIGIPRKQAVVCPGYLNYYKHTTVQLEEGNASSFMYGVVLMERAGRFSAARFSAGRFSASD